MTQLLIENAPFVLRLEESKDSAGNARYVVRGQFARSDKATENKRLYKEHLWRREIGRLNESMKARRAFGELDHPADGRTKLQRVSHLMTGLRIEGNEVVGEAEILDTPNGRILKSLFQAGAQVGVSSRGYGSTKSLPDGTEEVLEDFRLDTFDFVADPATRTAYPKVFQEEREHISQAESGMTIESLRRDYPGLLKEIAESSLGDVARQITEAEDRAKERLKSTFQAELRKTIENLSEEAYRKARSDLESDPEVAAAKTVVEQIVSLVSSFGMNEKIRADMEAKEQENSKLRAQLADRELEVQKTIRERQEFEKLAKKAGYQLHLERRVGDHPSKDTIIRLIGDVTTYRSMDEMDEKVSALLKEFVHAKPASQEAAERHDELTKQIEDLRARVAESDRKIAKAHEERDSALGKAREAVRISEGFQLQLHLEKKIAGRPDAARVRQLAESASFVTTEDVDSWLGKFSMSSSPDLSGDAADRIRTRVQRGKASSLVEDQPSTGSKNGNGIQGGGLLEQLGLGDEEFDRLVGNPRPQ